MKCDKCGIEINKKESVETINDEILCYGCDAKRLSEVK